MKKTVTRKTKSPTKDSVTRHGSLYIQRLTTTIGPWQQTCITPPWHQATQQQQEGQQRRRWGLETHMSRAPRYVCFFFSHINLTNGYLNTRLHVRPKRWPSPPP